MANAMDIGQWGKVVDGPFKDAVIHRLDAKDEYGNSMWVILRENNIGQKGEYGDYSWAQRVPVVIARPGDIITVTV
jgi:hypothetical protein